MKLEITDILKTIGNQLTKNTNSPGNNHLPNMLIGAFNNLTNSKSNDGLFSKITGGIATAGIAYGVDKTLGPMGNIAYLGLKSMGFPHMNKIAIGGMAIGGICQKFGLSHETSQMIGTLTMIAGALFASHAEKNKSPNIVSNTLNSVDKSLNTFAKDVTSSVAKPSKSKTPSIALN